MCFCQKYYGKKSSVGRDVCRLRKAYYSARHEAAVQIDEIVGETASEADSSDSLERDHVHHHHHGGGPGSHDKDDDIIRCICGMYKDEGLMIQCEKCMVSGDRETVPAAPALLISPETSWSLLMRFSDGSEQSVLSEYCVFLDIKVKKGRVSILMELEFRTHCGCVNHSCREAWQHQLACNLSWIIGSIPFYHSCVKLILL